MGCDGCFKQQSRALKEAVYDPYRYISKSPRQSWSGSPTTHEDAYVHQALELVR